MRVLSGVTLKDSLLSAFVSCGRAGHSIALAHQNDPGSNGFTFGTDRYHRSCELLKDHLEADGFTLFSRGAGLRARKGDLELHFATAKTADVAVPSSFDNRTDSRVYAGRVNSGKYGQAVLSAGSMLLHPTLDGLGEGDLPSRTIIHTVWSGDNAHGLVAVHIGRLVTETDDTVVWGEVNRIDRDGVFVAEESVPGGGDGASYSDQPEPDLGLEMLEFDAAPGAAASINAASINTAEVDAQRDEK